MKAYEEQSAFLYATEECALDERGREILGCIHIHSHSNTGIYLYDTSATQGYCFITRSLD